MRAECMQYSSALMQSNTASTILTHAFSRYYRTRSENQFVDHTIRDRHASTRMSTFDTQMISCQTQAQKTKVSAGCSDKSCSERGYYYFAGTLFPVVAEEGEEPQRHTDSICWLLHEMRLKCDQLHTVMERDRFVISSNERKNDDGEKEESDQIRQSNLHWQTCVYVSVSEWGGWIRHLWLHDEHVYLCVTK